MDAWSVLGARAAQAANAQTLWNPMSPQRRRNWIAVCRILPDCAWAANRVKTESGQPRDFPNKYSLAGSAAEKRAVLVEVSQHGVEQPSTWHRFRTERQAKKDRGR